MNYAKLFLLIAALGGACAVLLGAFGAHALKASLSQSMMNTWQTAVQYQFYHCLALLLVAILMRQGLMGGWINVSGFLFVGGILFFCLSLYLLALGGPRWLGPVTPVGGLFFIAAWCSLFIAVLTSESRPQ